MFFLGRSRRLAAKIDDLCEVEELSSAKGKLLNHLLVVCTWYMVRHPRVSCTVYSLLSLQVTTPHQKTNQLIRSCHQLHVNLQAVLSRMQLTLHATRPTPNDPSRMAQDMSGWSVKTRRAPPRHCRDARVYGHTTTVMYDMSTPTPPRPAPHVALRLESVTCYDGYERYSYFR